MNTNQIRKFATEARILLLKGVSNSLRTFFSDSGEPIIVPKPVQGGCAFGAQTKDEAFLRRWQSLQHQITLHGFRWVVEQVAYTWFNRLVAINILAKNNLAEPMLQFANPSLRVPYIVEQARAGHFPEMSAADIATLRELLNNDALTFKQFSLLIGCYCTANPIIRRCFGCVDDHSLLLLPSNILFEGEIVDMLNRSDLITDDEYRSPELIGWLYQFYISERKDEVFAKKGKFEADEIPAATQIFTPNWIVKYMVQNSLGRIYLDNEPDSDLKERMQYLVSAEPSSEKFTFEDVKELTCADLACGSGHILNECFDLLYDIYIEQGYSRRDAVENIFSHNLIGVDIDTRAKQLATFALLLKACLRDASFADAHAMPRVLDMPEPYRSDTDLRDTLHHFFLGGTPKQIDETAEAIALFDYAEDLGSIMRFNISSGTREAIVRRLAEYRASDIHTFDNLFPYFDVILALTTKYAALVMNPPYMKASNMNDVLKLYTSKNYEVGAIDMYSTFMILAMNLVCKHGSISMIVQPTWLVNASFGAMRKYILDNFSLKSLLHMGRGNFGNDWGSIAFTLSKSANRKDSLFFKLYERTFYRIEPEHIQELFLTAINNFNYRYQFSLYNPSNFDASDNPNGRQICYICNQEKFKRVLNYPFCYSFSDDIIDIINKTNISNYFSPATGLQTGNNNKFIRTWFETSKVDFNHKWFPLVDGGDYRKWYGNFDDLIYWYNDGFDIKNCKSSVLRNQQYYKKAGITWNRIASKSISLRAFPNGCFFDQAGDSMFAQNIDDLHSCMGYLNTKVAKAFFEMLAPTINLTAGMIGKLPYKTTQDKSILYIVNQNISISKQDWDAHETSWDFKENELVRIFNDNGWGTLDIVVSEYNREWERLFMQLHANEEELNRQFIDIYGLQDELTPDVPLDEITILQQGEIHIENNDIVWHNDVIAKQLISYAIGCWMGRYRLDKPGLHIAHPNPTAEEVCTYTYNGSELEIDDDGIIPILRADSSFADNACHRVRDFLRIAFGEENLLENINFIETCLGKSIEAYFMKDLWKDHKKMYQNRPIYWLFSSKKGAFQCLAYMHRMDAYTVERVRSKYLLPHMDWLTHRINELRANDAMLTTAQRKTAELLEKELAECREYHERLHYVADQQISFDLDDGVVVNYAKFGDILAKIK